jgi:hypothetical protein
MSANLNTDLNVSQVSPKTAPTSVAGKKEDPVSVVFKKNVPVEIGASPTLHGRKIYKGATLLAGLAALMPLIKIALCLIAGVAVAFSPLGWALLIGALVVFLISSIALIVANKGHRLDACKTVAGGALGIVLSPLYLLYLLLNGSW